MKWKVGDSAQLTAVVDDQRIRNFAVAVEDLNPIHLDDEAAMKSIFGRRVAHGMISASFISAILGTRLPGPGSILLGQSFKYIAPVYVDDIVTASVTVTAIRDDKPILTLDTKAVNQHGQTVLTGEATVLFRELDDWRERQS
ncbi:MaoC family dehydratase [bacterium]|nr:MaoC family dehydratase [bacterium]